MPLSISLWKTWVFTPLAPRRLVAGEVIIPRDASPLSANPAKSVLGAAGAQGPLHSCLPTPYLASFCPCVFSCLFAKFVSLSVRFVYFETHLCYPDSVKVHVHSCLTLSLLGVRTPKRLSLGLPFLTGKGLYSTCWDFFQEKKIVRIDESLFRKSVDESGAKVTGRICFGQ